MTSAGVAVAPRSDRASDVHPLAFLLPGIFFGIVISKAEVISWYRIQEMFRFQSFHMYGVIGSAVVVAWLAQLLLSRFGVGSEVTPLPQEEHSQRLGHAQWIGGTLFGIGWGLTGACPGPIFALIGNGVTVAVVILLSAIAGTWVYAHVRGRLPH